MLEIYDLPNQLYSGSLEVRNITSGFFFVCDAPLGEERLKGRLCYIKSLLDWHGQELFVAYVRKTVCGELIGVMLADIYKAIQIRRQQ
mgnify:CR=1 FL=1